MKKELDPYTFGNSAAAITLAKILSQEGYDKYCKRVSTKYHDFCQVMWAIFEIKDVHVRSSLFHLVWVDSRQRATKINVPAEVRSYLLNIMKATYKMNITECDEIIKENKREEQREATLKKKRAALMKADAIV